MAREEREMGEIRERPLRARDLFAFLLVVVVSAGAERGEAGAPISENDLFFPCAGQGPDRLAGGADDALATEMLSDILM